MDRIRVCDTRTEQPSALLAEVESDAWGQVSASIYDTARLVTSTPWLTGHTERIAYLCREQGTDGAWGQPDGYALVPTMSATEALLSELLRDPAAASDQLVAAADRGIDAVQRQLGAPAIPDTIAVELVVPALASALRQVLASLESVPGNRFPSRWSELRLAVPPQLDPGLLAALHGGLEQGRSLPPKLWASLETLGDCAVGAPFVQPADGAIAGSPAATASWLGPAAAGGAGIASESARYLYKLQARSGGPVPGVTPITYFEAAWVLNTLATAGVPYEVPAVILDRLDASLGDDGAPAGPGIPVDSDDTAAVLSALARHGRLRSPEVLLRYQGDGYFTCFLDERTPSISTNAHIMEALGLYLRARPAEWPRFGPALHMVSSWLLDNQAADGSWLDKWHASPYYATACCAVVLADFAGDESGQHLIRAVDWVLNTQRPDGSWGRWQGTVEETAYALHTLLLSGESGQNVQARADGVARAAAAGAGFLAGNADPATFPALWHAKDLYAPTTVIRAARIAALRLATACAERS
jgi:halimadienyl-diphosphate synthase